MSCLLENYSLLKRKLIFIQRIFPSNRFVLLSFCQPFAIRLLSFSNLLRPHLSGVLLPSVCFRLPPPCDSILLLSFCFPLWVFTSGLLTILEDFGVTTIRIPTLEQSHSKILKHHLNNHIPPSLPHHMLLFLSHFPSPSHLQHGPVTSGLG